MDLPTVELFSMLTKLLPGFLAATVFHSLTPYPKRDVFDRIVSALLFTLVVQAFVICVKPLVFIAGRHLVSFGPWTSDTEVVWGAVAAVAIGLGWAATVNNQQPHRRLRSLRLTKKTSLPNQWFSAFSQHERFVVLNMKDGRRVLGWPSEWPDDADSGHFVLLQAAWLLDNGERVEMFETEAIMFAVADVEFVEFLRSPIEVAKVADAATVQKQRELLFALQREKADGNRSETQQHRSSG